MIAGTPVPPAPAGSPEWLIVASGVAALLVGLFGRGFVGSIVAWVRNRRAGLAVRETEARQQEREYRASERSAVEAETERAFQRLGQQAEDQGRVIAELRAEVDELRDQMRAQYAREQTIMSGLTYHAGWDFLARPYLPQDFPEAPPLLPPRDQVHATEWGVGNG